MWKNEWFKDNLVLRTIKNMTLYNNPEKGADWKYMGSDYYLKVQKIQKNENGSVYANVEVYHSPYAINCITKGWISLDSDGFVVYENKIKASF